MKIGFKVRIYPTKEQEKILLYYCKIYHNMWNFLVEKYSNVLPTVSAYGLKNYQPQDLMKDFNVKIPQRIVLAVLKNFAFTVKKIYLKQIRNINFHKFNPNKQSFYMASTTHIIKDGYAVLPLNKGDFSISKKIILDNEIFKKNNISIIIEPHYSYVCGKWYLSGCYNSEDISKNNRRIILGLDWGLKTFMTSSEGEFINYPDAVKREYQRIRKLQSIIDKKVKHSKNYEKLLLKLQLAYERFENLKRDFIEKETTLLAKNYHISVEKLDRKLLIHKVRRRNNLISPRYRFIEKLKWKCEKYGSYFIEVSPAYTSRRCCKCGKLHHMPLSKRIMECGCGNILNRDINAAINIANDGREILLSMGVCCTY